MIGCPMDGCPELFVLAILLGRQLRRRIFGTEPDPAEEPFSTTTLMSMTMHCMSFTPSPRVITLRRSM